MKNEIKSQIEKHYKNQTFCCLIREVAPDWIEKSRGYIVDYSENFVVLQETDDFKILGFSILPISYIKQVRYNNNDKYYDKIMLWEKEKINIGLRTKVDLTDWKTIFRTFQKEKKNIIVKCENPEIDTFVIGEIKSITDKTVSILYFNAAGFLDETPTKTEYEDITKIIFDDRYIDVFSKYTRERKKK